MALPRMRVAIMLVLVLQVIFLIGTSVKVDGGVIIENRSNVTGVSVSVYDGGLSMVLEIGLLDPGSVIDWDAVSMAPTNYTSPFKGAPPVPSEHLFVMKSFSTNVTITSQYFFDGYKITVVDDAIGGLSIKAAAYLH